MGFGVLAASFRAKTPKKGRFDIVSFVLAYAKTLDTLDTGQQMPYAQIKTLYTRKHANSRRKAETRDW